MEKEFGGLLRLRLGDYRVFFRPESDGSILIVRVLHRSEAYR
jgi:mRNA-degrading endonuclease RelE of RelBE toxin-antitoxin system